MKNIQTVLRWVSIGLGAAALQSLGIAQNEPAGGEGKGGAGLAFRDTPFRVTVTMRGGYDDNVGTTRDKQGSWFTNAYAALNAHFDSPRTKLTLGLAGGGTYYGDLEGNKWDYTATLQVGLVHRATDRLTLTSRIYLTYQVEPDFSLLLGNERRGGQYIYLNTQFAASYQWTPRFTTVTSYGLTGVFYDDSASANVEDRFEHFFSEEFRFLLQPTLTAVAEYRLAYYDYTDNTDQSGFSHYVLLGLDHTFSPRLNTSWRGGIERRDNAAAGATLTPYGELTLNYLYGRYSSISWINRYGQEQSDLGANTDERKTFRTGLRIRHGFTPKLSLYAGAYYHRNDYSGNTSFTENVYDLSTGVTFAINRVFSLDTGYTFTQVSSGQETREYDRNRFHVGGSVSF